MFIVTQTDQDKIPRSCKLFSIMADRDLRKVAINLGAAARHVT